MTGDLESDGVTLNRKEPYFSWLLMSQLQVKLLTLFDDNVIHAQKACSHLIIEGSSIGNNGAVVLLWLGTWGQCSCPLQAHIKQDRDILYVPDRAVGL